MHLSGHQHMKDLCQNRLLDILYDAVMKRGIHPGYCAVLYDEKAMEKIFPPEEGGLAQGLKMLNEALKSKVEAGQAQYAPQLSTYLEESIHYRPSKETSLGQYTLDLMSDGATDVKQTVQY